MIALPLAGETARMSPFYLPSKYTLEVLNTNKFVACYSGGKDSTSLVTWVEWLRRVGLLKVEKPKLVLSDTGSEYPFLVNVTDKMLDALRASGWDCEIVRPKRIKKLYVAIFGRGLLPVLLGTKGMRWCTSQTKVQPMKDFVKRLPEDHVQLTGMRWGESEGRDIKLKVGGCVAGGECGLPPPGEGTYGPIVQWRAFEVFEWLDGKFGDPNDLAIKAVHAKFGDPAEVLKDLIPVMRELVQVYEPQVQSKGFGLAPPSVRMIRFGCKGCPALVKDKVVSKKAMKDPRFAAVNRVYAIWDELRKVYNRLSRPNATKRRGIQYGPPKLAVRKKLFKVLLEIQKESGCELVSPKDIKLIKKMWRTGACYTRTWDRTDDPTWKE